MASVRFVVGVNDGPKPFDKKGKPYEKVHIESCKIGQWIKGRRKFFSTYEEAEDFATEHKAARCCKRKIEEELGRPLP